MDEVYSFLKTLSIKKKDALIVAVSYGPDSMFLLNLIKKIYEENKIICAHVHHNHRNESDDEAKKLRAYCNKNNIIFEFMKIDSYNNDKFTEQEARERRYEFFDSLINKYDSKYLFTAHHGDDLVETILMKISRGSSLKGYSGINLISKRNNYNVVRPLLYLTKEKILSECNKLHIPYAVDKSNKDNTYTRNRYRNNILPYLKEENGNIHKKFLSFSNTLKEYDDYVNGIVLEKYKKIVIDDIINTEFLLKEDKFIIKKIIEHYLFNIYEKDITNIGSNHVNDILEMVNSSRTNIKLSMPNKINIIKSYNKIYFDKDIDYNSYCYVFDDYLELPNGYILKKIDTLENTSNYVAAFDSKDILLPLYVRNKMDGDKISVLNLDGTKKIKDIFIDEKVDIKKRGSYPVLVDSNGTILWLPGLKKSKYDKSKTKKYDIILKYYKEEKTNAE